MQPSDRDIDDEISAHLERRAQELITQGLSPERAASEARRLFGDPAAFKRACASVGALEWPPDTRRDRCRAAGQDLRFALRALRRGPRFTITAVVILALGVGLTTAIAAIVDDALLRPLPYPDADRLVAVWSANAQQQESKGHVSPADFYDLEARALGLPGTAMFGYMSWPVTLTGVDEPERLVGALVTPGITATLGVPVGSGRALAEQPESALEDAVLISHRLAVRLGLDRDPSRHTLRLNGAPARVVGVMPAGFAFPSADTDVWIPLVLSLENRTNRASRWLKVVARLPDDVTMAEADRRLDEVMAQLEAENPATNGGWSGRLTTLHDEVIGSSRGALLALAGAVLAMALVTCVNMTSLTLNRLSRRAAELRIQLAIGAGRIRVMRQLAAEALLLAIAGTALGLLTAAGLVAGFRRWAPESLPRAQSVEIGGGAIAIAAGVAMAVAVTTIALTALSRRWWRTLTRGPQDGRRVMTRGAARHDLVVVVQTAVVTVLMAVTGLFGQAFVALARTDLGFSTDDVMTMRLQLGRSQYPSNEAQLAFFNRVLEEVAARPEVAAVAAISDLPIRGNSVALPLVVDGRHTRADEAEPSAALRVVTPNYLPTMRTPLLRGRGFDATDGVASALVAVVNESLARQHWPDAAVLGRRIRIGDDPEWRTIVGVVPDVRHAGPAVDEGPAVYVPHTQKSEAWLNWMWLAVRPRGQPSTVVPPVRQAVARVDPNQAISDVARLDRLAAESIAMPRMNALVALAASLVTVVLAVSGVSALVAQLVARRRGELAIRLALGATTRQLARLPIRHALGLVVAGGCVGIAMLLIGSRFLRAQVPGLPPNDWWTVAGTTAVLVAGALLAAIGPVRTVLRIDPATALRGD